MRCQKIQLVAIMFKYNSLIDVSLNTKKYVFLLYILFHVMLCMYMLKKCYLTIRIVTGFLKVLFHFDNNVYFSLKKTNVSLSVKARE